MNLKPLYKAENYILVGLKSDFQELCVLDGLVVETYDPQLGVYKLSGNVLHTPPIVIIWPQLPPIMHLTGMLWEADIFSSLGEGGTAVLNFGTYGTLTDNFKVTGVNPLTISHTFSGTLSGLPEVTLPMEKNNINFTWYGNGQAEGTETIKSERADGSGTFYLPVSFTITYTANPGITLPANYTGWAKILQYTPATGEVVGQSSHTRNY